MIGYNWSFVSGGIALMVYSVIYYCVCGTGEMYDEEPSATQSSIPLNGEAQQTLAAADNRDGATSRGED